MSAFLWCINSRKLRKTECSCPASPRLRPGPRSSAHLKIGGPPISLVGAYRHLFKHSEKGKFRADPFAGWSGSKSARAVIQKLGGSQCATPHFGGEESERRFLTIVLYPFLAAAKPASPKFTKACIPMHCLAYLYSHEDDAPTSDSFADREPTDPLARRTRPASRSARL